MQEQATPPPVLNLDRPLPCNLEAETAVLGTIMAFPKYASTALSALHFGGAFHRAAHQTIFDAILELNAGKSEAALDPVVLGDHLKRLGKLEEIGGQEYLWKLMDSQVTGANIEHYIDIVKQNAMLRHVITTCSTALAKCYDAADDAKNIMDSVSKDIFEIEAWNEKKDLIPIGQLTVDAVRYLDSLSKADEGMLGLRTGYDFDRYITGLKPGELFVLAARPSIGKTALALNIVSNIAVGEKGVPVGFFSLEMPALQLVLRLLCGLTRLSMTQFRYRQISTAQWDDVMRAAEQLQKASIIIDDTGGIDILELRAKARRMVQKNGIKALFIDYLQLIKANTNRNASRENEVAQISGSLKALAKELNIPIVVLAQINRAGESQGNEKPKLSNLRESGAIEQDADVVAILHRDRDKQYAQKMDDDLPLKAELIIAKNRNGSTGEQELLFYPKITRFENPALERQGDV